MKKICIISFFAAILAGCASIAPVQKADWSGVNAADIMNLKSGVIALPEEKVTAAVAAVLKAEGWELENAAKSGAITTVRKHGVTFYGSCDYALSCGIKPGQDSAKLSWSTISYVTKFLTNVDPLDSDSAERWNIAVYKNLISSGDIRKEEKADADENADAQEKTAPAAGEPELPAPPQEE